MLLRKGFIIFLVLWIGFACNSANYTTVRHVKPVNRNRGYIPGKDKRKKRVKLVKKKILKRSPEIKPPKKKRVKEKEIELDSTAIPPPNEPDSTGIF